MKKRIFLKLLPVLSLFLLLLVPHPALAASEGQMAVRDDAELLTDE